MSAIRAVPFGRRIHAYQVGRKGEGRQEAGRAEQALAAVVGARRDRGRQAALARRRRQQNVGLHQEEQSPEPGEQARDSRRRQAREDLRKKEGHHVRDEQAHLAAPQGLTRFSAPAGSWAGAGAERSSLSAGGAPTAI